MAATNEQVLWRGPVESGAVALEDFIFESGVPGPEEPQAGQALVELIYVSVDPYMRGRMKSGAGYFVGPFQANKPLESTALAKVLKVGAGTEGGVKEGAFVLVPGAKWQKQQLVQAAGVMVLDEQICKDTGLPLSVWMGALGMTGLTAYTSLERIGKPKEGDTAFVSGAAGAVGLIVGQLLKNVYGLSRVVGSAGTDEKVKLLLEVGYDAGTNYKTESIREAFPRLVPDGLDIYYDNVGGETLEAALDSAKTHARVVACGSISQYNATGDDRYGVKNLFQIIGKRILMQGFIVADYADMRVDFYQKMSAWLREGKVKNFEHVVPGGLAVAGQAFVDMMKGVNIGKAIVQVGPDPYRK